MNKKLSNSKKSLRRHDHDWLRVMAILLIFVYHAAAPFHPWFDWHIRAYPKSELIGYLSAAGYSWPLPLFMLLAGAATWFALRKRSYRQYAGERFTRILLPLIAAMIILIPPQVYMERWRSLSARQYLGRSILVLVLFALLRSVGFALVCLPAGKNGAALAVKVGRILAAQRSDLDFCRAIDHRTDRPWLAIS
jgi:hypothetical protein